ncbi:right-handed parallel beta-helix repeat-containing protein [bacterium]|nr:right-handed parallel beta-helix repeat-containing protein [bacterium]
MSKFNSLVFAVSLAAFLPHSARADVEVAKYKGDTRDATCTVPDSGYYALTNTRIREAEASRGEKLEIVVRVGDNRVVFKTEGTSGDAFDTPLGFIAKGSSVHVTAGDETSVGLDFTVVRKDMVTVAGFRDDFQGAAFPSGWRYLWNKPVGCTASNPGDLGSAGIGDPSEYRDLVWDGDRAVYSVHGDDDYSRTPSGSLKLSKELGSPGFAYDEDVSTSQDRYVIASYEVDAAGYYAIADSWLKESDTTDGDPVEVLIHIDDHSPVLRQFTRNPSDTVTFDTDLAYLEPGSKIYVCVGPNTRSDGDAFSMDYHIVRLGGGKPIRAQIANATGPSVRIFPTRYYAKTQQIQFSAAKDFEVNGYGALYILTDHYERFITMDGCSKVRILGLTMDYDPLHFTQGEILDIQGNLITLKPMRGYPRPKLGEGHYSSKSFPHEPSTMRWKPGVTVSSVVDVSQTGDNYLLQMSTKPRDLGWVPGDYMSFYEKGIGSVVYFTQCQDLLMKDLTLHQYGGWGVSSNKGVRNTYDGLRLTPGPKPLLATVERLRAGDYDGIDLPFAEAPTIQNCLIEANCDDAIHIWGEMFFALQDAKGSNVVQVCSRATSLEEGMEIYIQTAAGKEVRRVVSMEPSTVSPEDAEAALKPLYPKLRLYLGFLDHRVQLTLDKPVTLATGDFASAPAKGGGGLRILNNVIRNNPGRAMVIKCVDGVIEGNDVSYMGGPAVKMEVEAETYGTGGFAENVLIRNNRFTAVAAHTTTPQSIGKAAAILLDCVGRDLMRFDNIRIEDNTFVDCYGTNVILTDAKNVTLKGNKFVNAGRYTSQAGTEVDPTVQGAIIWTRNVSNVVLDDTNRNYYFNKAPGMDTTAGAPITGVLYPGRTATHNLEPVADSYVQGGNQADSNWGTWTVLRCKEDRSNENYTRRTYLRFDLCSVISSTVLRAATRLKVRTADSAGDTHTLYAVADDSWEETAITWNAETAVGAPLASAAHPTSVGEWLDLDVTEQVLAELKGDRLLSAMLASNGTVLVSYHSREAAPEDRPQLIIETLPKEPAETGDWSLELQ